jgi:hypothetical protein
MAPSLSLLAQVYDDVTYPENVSWGLSAAGAPAALALSSIATTAVSCA